MTQPDASTRFSEMVELCQKSVNRMAAERMEREGETCRDCGGRVVTDRTPSFVFKEMDVCECGQGGFSLSHRA